ncbi:unnamed protein product [Callosobruchus maculatus]|uniref:Uncharacterized protein n=1 Tax=Callosobruchus maculatus TaxID=64391 RepID=A0A653D5V9_CALMS|nr:unnamed protein product [Callosobruchus maculatus]
MESCVKLEFVKITSSTMSSLHKNTKHLIIRENGDTIFQLLMIVKDHLLKRSRSEIILIGIVYYV